MYFLYCLVCIIIVFLVLCLIPWSPLKDEFQRDKRLLMTKSQFDRRIIEEKDIEHLPKPLKKYFSYCGFLGKPMMQSSCTEYHNVDFVLNDKSVKIKRYIQVNVATVCERVAFIDMRMAGFIPFQGIDDNIAGRGRMHGVLGKVNTIFDVTGKEMDQSAVVTAMAECMVCPSFFILYPNIIWKEIDSTHVLATLTAYGMTVKGMYEFNKEGAMVSFTTGDRYKEVKGDMVRCDWRVDCSGYKESNGIKKPTKLEASWVEDGKKEVYFSGNDFMITYQ